MPSPGKSTIFLELETAVRTELGLVLVAALGIALVVCVLMKGDQCIKSRGSGSRARVVGQRGE
jgi:hypothetical protein